MKLLRRNKPAIPPSIEWSADSKNNHPISNEKAEPMSIMVNGKPLLEVYTSSVFQNMWRLTKGKKNKNSLRNMHVSQGDVLHKSTPKAKMVKEEAKAMPREKAEGTPEDETAEAVNGAVVDAVIEKEVTPMEEEVASVKQEEVAPVKQEEVAPVKEEEVAPVKEEEVTPIEETSEDASLKEATPFEETLMEKAKQEESDGVCAVSFEDITLEPSIEAVEQNDAVVLGQYQPVAPEEEQEKKSAFDEAVHNLQLMIDGAVVQTMTLGSQGMDLLTCYISDVKDYAENNDLLLATPTPQEKDYPKAQASMNVKPEAEESFIHPMVLEKFNDFVEQIKSKVEQPSSDDKNPETLQTSGLGTTGFKKQTSAYVGDTTTGEDVNNELALDEDNRNDCAEVNPALVNEEVRQ